VFKECKVLTDSEHLPLLPVMLQNSMRERYVAFRKALAEDGSGREHATREHAVTATVDGRIRNTAATATSTDSNV
jgi:hypothetical protein